MTPQEIQQKIKEAQDKFNKAVSEANTTYQSALAKAHADYQADIKIIQGAGVPTPPAPSVISSPPSGVPTGTQGPM